MWSEGSSVATARKRVLHPTRRWKPLPRCDWKSAPGEVLKGETVEMVASRHPRPGEMEAYERVLGDALAGDATLFARQDYVEEAWRIVDPVLKAGTQVYDYEPGSWGP